MRAGINFTGKVVALDPDKIKDSDQLFIWLNKPAIVVSLNRKTALALIVFSDETQCEIKAEHLIMLKRQGDIVMKLIRNWNMSTGDFQKITRISKLMLKGAFADAMELAISNETIRKYCTLNCGEWMVRQKQKLSKRKM